MVVRLSALRTGCFLTPEDAPGTHFCSRPQFRSVAGRIMSIKKNSNDTKEDRTSDLPICGVAS